MIKEFIKGFISVPVNLYNSITLHDSYMLGRVIGIIFIILVITTIFVIIINIIDSKK